MLCVLILYSRFRTSDFLRNCLWQFLIYFHRFCQKSALRKSPKKYFSYFVLMSGLGLESWLFVLFHYFRLWTFLEVLWDIQYFWYFHLVLKWIYQKAFQLVSRPHRAEHVRTMDSPNLIISLRKRVASGIAYIWIRMTYQSVSFGYVVCLHL